MHIERVATIDAPPAAVWELLIDPNRVQEWMPEIISYHTDDQEPAVGTISTMKVKEGSKEVEYITEILEYEPVEHLVVEMRGGSLGPNPMRIGYDVEPTNSAIDHMTSGTRDQTALTYRADWEASGLFMTLMVPLIRFMAGRNASQAMARLGAVVSKQDA